MHCTCPRIHCKHPAGYNTVFTLCCAATTTSAKYYTPGYCISAVNPLMSSRNASNAWITELSFTLETKMKLRDHGMAGASTVLYNGIIELECDTVKV